MALSLKVEEDQNDGCGGGWTVDLTEVKPDVIGLQYQQWLEESGDFLNHYIPGDGPFLAQDEFVHTMYYFANEEDTIDIEQPTHTASITNHSSRQKRVREDETTPTIEPWMQCRYCQKAFHKGAHLRRHERIHTGIKPYVCMTCNRSFSRQDSLIRHEKLHNKATVSDTASLALEREVTSSNSSPHDSGVVAAHVYNSPPPSHASIFEMGSTAKETQGNSHTTWPY